MKELAAMIGQNTTSAKKGVSEELFEWIVREFPGR
jgi:hypothetical protein